MLIKVGRAWAHLVEATIEEEEFVRQYLTFSVSSRPGAAVASESLFFRNKRVFPAGLASMVERAAVGRAMQVQLISSWKEPPWRSPGPHTLRPHQVAALEVARRLGRGVIQHATGAGKGTLIEALSWGYHTSRVLIVVTSKKLLLEMRDRLLAIGIAPGLCGAGNFDTTRRVTIVVDKSLKKLPAKVLKSFDVLLCDEVQGAAARGYWKGAMECSGATVRLGFSATPLHRADKRTIYIVGALGEVIHRYSPTAAARDGAIAKASITMLRHRSKAYSASTYTTWERHALANNKKRNMLLHDVIAATASPRIIFVRTLDHQEALAKELPKAGVVNGLMEADEQSRICRQLALGEITDLISTPALRQGVDIPAISTVINMAGGKATIDVIQKVGRGSRRFQTDGTTKETFDVFDIFDEGCGCEGKEHKSCEWFRRHSDLRRKAYEEFGYKVSIL